MGRGKRREGSHSPLAGFMGSILIRSRGRERDGRGS